MTTRPSEELAPLKPVAREFRGEITQATLAPSGEMCTETWFEDWKNNGGQAYALNDLRTKKGRLAVALYNGWRDDWNEKEEGYDDTETVSKKIYDLLHKLAGSQNDNTVYLGHTEGLHRAISLTHVLTESKIDAFSAKLKPRSLTVDNFKTHGLRSQQERTANVIHDAVSEALSGDKKNSMMDEPISLLVTYVTNPGADAKKVLAACRRKSQGISDSKLNSAKPCPSYLIGSFGERWMKSMPLVNLARELDTRGSTTPVVQRATVAAVRKTKEETPNSKKSASPLLDEPIVQAYLNDPLNEQKRVMAENALKCEVLKHDGEETIGPLKPPYYVDYSRMATESGSLSGKMYSVTGEMRNEIILLPIVMLHLYAGSKNLTPGGVSNDQTLKDLTDYTLRYHFGAETGQANLYQLHGDLVGRYSLDYGTGYLNSPYSGIIGASVMIVNMWNSCITLASHQPDLTSIERLAKVHEAAELFGGAFATLDSTVGNPTVDSTIYHLGEIMQAKLIFSE